MFHHFNRHYDLRGSDPASPFWNRAPITLTVDMVLAPSRRGASLEDWRPLERASPAEIVGQVLRRHAVEAAQPFFEPAVVGVDVVDVDVGRGGVRLARRGYDT